MRFRRLPPSRNCTHTFITSVNNSPSNPQMHIPNSAQTQHTASQHQLFCELQQLPFHAYNTSTIFPNLYSQTSRERTA